MAANGYGGRRARQSAFPWWAWLLVALAVAAPLCAAGVVGVVVVAKSSKREPLPQSTVSDLHKSWYGRSMRDWMREYGEADRSDYIGYGGQFVYARPLAISDKTGKPCGLEVKITQGTVDWVTEYPLP